MNYLSRAIQYLRPNSEFSYTEDDYSTIKWYALEGDAPTQKEINDAIKTVKANEIADAKAKAIKRQEILDRLGLTADELQTILG